MTVITKLKMELKTVSQREFQRHFHRYKGENVVVVSQGIVIGEWRPFIDSQVTVNSDSHLSGLSDSQRQSAAVSDSQVTVSGDSHPKRVTVNTPKGVQNDGIANNENQVDSDGHLLCSNCKRYCAMRSGLCMACERDKPGPGIRCMKCNMYKVKGIYEWWEDGEEYPVCEECLRRVIPRSHWKSRVGKLKKLC